MNDCGPMLWATRSRRCFSSARRSLSANAGAGGVIRMLEGIALSFLALVARTATSGLSIAKHANRASSANITRVVFFIFVLLNQPQKAQSTKHQFRVKALACSCLPGGRPKAELQTFLFCAFCAFCG